MNKQKGFSLIELLIVLVCVGVLLSIAVPNYQTSVMRSHRAQARVALLQTAHWLERAASANGIYPLVADIPNSVLQVEGQRYRISVVSSAQTFALTAVPIGVQTNDACGSLTLDNLGTRGVQNSSRSATQCWSK